jgi:hypothetical protein
MQKGDHQLARWCLDDSVVPPDTDRINRSILCVQNKGVSTTSFEWVHIYMFFSSNQTLLPLKTHTHIWSSRVSEALEVICKFLKVKIKDIISAYRVASVHPPISCSCAFQVRSFACYSWSSLSPRWLGGVVLGELSRRFLVSRPKTVVLGLEVFDPELENGLLLEST